MAEAPKTIEGPDGENWNSWLVQDKEEILDITKPKLQTHLRLLARRDDGMNTPSYLQEVHTNLEKMIIDGEVTLEEAGPWMIKIEDRHRTLVEEEKLNQPPINVQIPDRAPAIEQPLHVGAAVANGRREMYLVDKGLIDRVDISKREDRRKFILKNLYAYNFLYLKSSEISTTWLAVVKDWEADINVAREKTGVLNNKEYLEFDKQLKAAMAITASARAMEVSGGSFNSYGIALSGGEKGASSDWQDKNKKYILHADPEKIKIVLEDPAVRAYYNHLIEDSGLSDDKFLEWDWKTQEPNNPILRNPYYLENNGKKRFTQEIRDGVLVSYLKDSAIKGGFDSYIDEVLLKKVRRPGDDIRVKKAAAKLACDIFLVDKWTRWEELITDKDSDISGSMGLQPSEEWAGDPLKSVIKPSFLPRLKGVYSGPDSVVLDAIDLAFRPTDIYKSISKNNVVLYGSPVGFKTRLPVPSMVTNLKTLIRYNGALDKVLGGPMAASLPSWTTQTMGDLTGPGGTFDLIDQVYGSQKIKVPEDNDPRITRDFEIGKHIAGDVAIRILYAKALALTLESSKPGFAQKMQILFDPGGKTRPYLDILIMLAGPNRDGTRGLIKSIQGGRLDFVVDKNNVFLAQRYYRGLVKMLETDDQTGGTSSEILNAAGFVLDAGTAVANAFGLIGGRK